MFEGLNSLTVLSLPNNKITNIGTETFAVFSRTNPLVFVDLTSNRAFSLNGSILSGQRMGRLKLAYYVNLGTFPANTFNTTELGNCKFSPYVSFSFSFEQHLSICEAA